MREYVDHDDDEIAKPLRGLIIGAPIGAALWMLIIMGVMAGCRYLKPITNLLPGPVAASTTTTTQPPSVTTTTVQPVLDGAWLGSYLPAPQPAIAVVHFRSWDQPESMGSVHPDTVRLLGTDGVILAASTRTGGSISAHGDWFSAQIVVSDLPRLIAWEFQKGGKTTRYVITDSTKQVWGIKPE